MIENMCQELCEQSGVFDFSLRINHKSLKEMNDRWLHRTPNSEFIQAQGVNILSPAANLDAKVLFLIFFCSLREFFSIKGFCFMASFTLALINIVQPNP